MFCLANQIPNFKQRAQLIVWKVEINQLVCLVQCGLLFNDFTTDSREWTNHMVQYRLLDSMVYKIEKIPC